MTAHTQLAITPRDRFLKEAEKEMIHFERREIEFRKKERDERAAELREKFTSDESRLSW